MRLDVLVGYIIVTGIVVFGFFLFFRKPRRKVGVFMINRFDENLVPYLILENQDILNVLENGEEIVLKVKREED